MNHFIRDSLLFQQQKKILLHLRKQSEKAGYTDLQAYIRDQGKAGNISPESATLLMKLQSADIPNQATTEKRRETSERMLSEQKSILEKVRNFLKSAPQKIGEALLAIPVSVLTALNTLPSDFFLPILLLVAIVGMPALGIYLAMNPDVLLIF